MHPQHYRFVRGKGNLDSAKKRVTNGRLSACLSDVTTSDIQDNRNVDLRNQHLNLMLKLGNEYIIDCICV